MQPAVLHTTSATVKIMLCGSRQSVIATIQQLHKAGFVEISAWCQPQPVPDSPTEQVISLTSKRLLLH